MRGGRREGRGEGRGRGREGREEREEYTIVLLNVGNSCIGL